MKIKLCGFTEEQSLLCAIENQCDFIGLVFVENSARNVDLETANRLGKLIPMKVAKVAVVVNQDLSRLEAIYQSFQPDIWQFHGDEPASFLIEIKEKFPQTKIIKAFKFNENLRISEIKSYESIADFYLFDGQLPGSGVNFDWQNFSALLPKLIAASSKPWFLSGGINSENFSSAVKITGAKMIDISSGIEEIRGVKSVRLISEFMKIAKNRF